MPKHTVNNLKDCARCGESFSPPTGRGGGNQKYCSVQCRTKHRNEKKQNKTLVMCPQCGQGRWLLHPHLAGKVCRPCSAANGSEVAREVNIQDPEERFLKYVNHSENGCWEWTGTLQKNGYSTFSEEGKPVRGHRWSYEHFVGPIPEGLQIDHLCRNRKCVNPDHLEPVTALENSRRAMRTHCVNGHEFTEDNIYWWTDGKRYCRTCRYERGRARQERNHLVKKQTVSKTGGGKV